MRFFISIALIAALIAPAWPESKENFMVNVAHQTVHKNAKQAKQKPKRKMIFQASAYDLGVDSCGKRPTSRGYGRTRSGKVLKGLSRKEAMTVAADTSILPLRTKVTLTFKGWRKKYNGVYTVYDTGSAVKGKRIDIYMGKRKYNECIKFGRVKVKVEVLKK